MKEKEAKTPLLAATNLQVIEGVDSSYEPRVPGNKLETYIKLFIYKMNQEKLTEVEKLTLYSLIDRFIFETDLGLRPKINFMKMRLIREILNVLQGGTKTLDIKRILETSVPEWFASSRTFYGIVLNKDFKLITWASRRRKKRFHASKYVGVGYKDKGKASNPSRDGSPSWQLVGQNIDAYITSKIRHPREFPTILKVPYERLTLRDKVNPSKFFDILVDNRENRKNCDVLITGLYPSKNPTLDDLSWLIPQIQIKLRKKGKFLLQVFAHVM